MKIFFFGILSLVFISSFVFATEKQEYAFKIDFAKNQFSLINLSLNEKEKSFFFIERIGFLEVTKILRKKIKKSLLKKVFIKFPKTKNWFELAWQFAEKKKIELFFPDVPLFFTFSCEQITDLHMAIINDNVLNVERILKKNPEKAMVFFEPICKKGFYGFPLHLAIKLKKNIRIIELILSACFYAGQQRDHLGETALNLAVFHNNTKAIELLLKTYPEMIYRGNKQGANALHVAAYHGMKNTLSLLLYFDLYFSDIPKLHSIKDKNGNTALDLAIYREKKEAIDLLVKKEFQNLILKKEPPRKDPSCWFFLKRVFS